MQLGLLSWNFIGWGVGGKLCYRFDRGLNVCYLKFKFCDCINVQIQFSWDFLFVVLRFWK